VLGLTLPSLITYVIVLLTAFSVHEFAHAWTANYFGDDTPRLYGRLTLNPLAHLDLIGSLMLIFAGIGWAKPVPVDPYVLRRRSPAALMWVSLAGPASNFLMAVVAAIPFRLGLVSTEAVSSTALVSLEFTYNGGASLLAWNDNGASCKYAALQRAQGSVVAGIRFKRSATYRRTKNYCECRN